MKNIDEGYVYNLLLKSLKEANKQCSQLLRDKVKLEGDIINLKDRLSKYENINKQLKK